MILPEKSARFQKVQNRKGRKKLSGTTRSIIAALAEAQVELNQIVKQTGAKPGHSIWNSLSPQNKSTQDNESWASIKNNTGDG